MRTNNNFSYRYVNNLGHWNVLNLGYMLTGMSTLASRLIEAIDDKKWSQEQLADVCNALEPNSISQVAIHKIATGKSKSTRKGPVLAKALSVNLDWLLTGEGPKRSTLMYSMSPELAERDGLSALEVEAIKADSFGRGAKEQYSINHIIHKYDTGISQSNGKTKTRIGNEPTKQLEMESNVSLGPELKDTIPLISWVQAGNASEVIDLLQPGDAYERVHTTVPKKAHTYALRVQGDSMSPEFPPGMILIVEPDMDPEIGDYVIAKNDNEEATFKKLVKDGGVMYLKPLNPAYPVFPLDGYQIIGVVRGVTRTFR